MKAGHGILLLSQRHKKNEHCSNTVSASKGCLSFFSFYENAQNRATPTCHADYSMQQKSVGPKAGSILLLVRKPLIRRDTLEFIHNPSASPPPPPSPPLFRPAGIGNLMFSTAISTCTVLYCTVRYSSLPVGAFYYGYYTSLALTLPPKRFGGFSRVIPTPLTPPPFPPTPPLTPGL